ncbi:MAG: 16S rRNA (cytosine(1402)-N(4))-methyltransferase RsmH [Dehalococcoidia bacterium]
MPVLLAEVLDRIAVRPGGWYVDGTLGLGGHAEAILAASAPDGRLLGIEQDPEARRRASDRLAAAGHRVLIVAGNNRDLAAYCRDAAFMPVDGVLLDLGISSLQLGPSGRGFSFQHDAPLDMRMDPSAELTAAAIVNEWPEEQIAGVLWQFGDERRSRRVAAAIVRNRPLRTTTALAAVVARAVGAAGPIHPATRTFQALRIAVNDEFGALREALNGAMEVIRNPGGRLAVISFHSGEDRIVKDFIRRESRDCVCPPGLPVCTCGHVARLKDLTRRGITPSPVEVAANPRSRSARLRVAERIEGTETDTKQRM